MRWSTRKVERKIHWTPYVGCWQRARIPREVRDMGYSSDQLEMLRQYEEDARGRRAARRRGRGGRS